MMTVNVVDVLSRVHEYGRGFLGRNGNSTGLGDGGSDVDNNDIQGLLNDTDAPDDVIYIVFGVIIAMLIAAVTIILVAVTISKIRKREDSAVSAVNVESVVHPHNHHNHHNHHSNNNNHQYHQNLHQVNHQQQQNGQKVNGGVEQVQQPQQQQPQNSPWVFPPLPPQPNIFSVNPLALMQANQDKHGFKGLKRQLSGRFKRMISRKPNEPPTPTIPPELKPQLKTIYVY